MQDIAVGIGLQVLETIKLLALSERYSNGAGHVGEGRPGLSKRAGALQSIGRVSPIHHVFIRELCEAQQRPAPNRQIYIIGSSHS